MSEVKNIPARKVFQPISSLSKSSEYRIWHSMKQRCSNPNNTHYDYYGGRGVKVCDRWRESFANFISDMGNRPSSGHTLDRFPNNNGNYEPGNCRWATRKEQQRNRRSNLLLTFNSKTQTAIEWCEELGIPKTRLLSRIARGWPVERALTETPDDAMYSFQGKTLPLAEWAKELGIRRQTLYCRLWRDWSVEEAFTSSVQKAGGRQP